MDPFLTMIWEWEQKQTLILVSKSIIVYVFCKFTELQDLRVLTSLGEGVSSYVNKVVHNPSGKIMAIKVLKANKEKDWMTYLCRELTIMRYSYSPYFLDFYGATVIVFSCSFTHIQDGTRVVMLMEYMDLGSLESIRNQLGGRISERILGRISRPVWMEYMYEN